MTDFIQRCRIRLQACLSLVIGSFSAALGPVLCGVLVLLLSAHESQAQRHYIFSVNQDSLAQISDFSSLNHSLAENDRVFVKSSHFYTVGADGVANTADDVRLRFFGISLSYSANFPAPKEAMQLAQRLRRLGFNAVRLHLLDSYLSDDLVKPNGLLTTKPFPNFNVTALQRLRGLIAACKQEGIYVDLNLHVAYQFRPSIDGVPDMGGSKDANYAYLFEPARMRLQVNYARQLIRALDLVDNPVLALVEINNEASLVSAWQTNALDSLSPASTILLQNGWRNWVLAHYGSVAHACTVWDSCGQTAQGMMLVRSGENAALLNSSPWLLHAGRLGDRILTKLGLDAQFEDGNLMAAPVRARGQRVSDYLRFLAATDAAYLHLIRTAVRDELGHHGTHDSTVPISGTQMVYGGLLNVDAQREMDYEDEHFYVDHYDFPGKPWDRLNWRIQDASLMRDKLDSLLQRAFYRDVNKPYVMSEFNQPYPNQQAAELLPVVVALASAQDWDGLFYYNYSNSATWPSSPDNFSLAGDPTKLVECGIIATMFRQFQIPALTSLRAAPISVAMRAKMAGLEEQVLWPRYLHAIYGLSPQHAWMYKVGIIPLRESTQRASVVEQVMPLPDKAQYIQADGSVLGVNLEQHQLRMTGKYSRLFVGYAEVNNPTTMGSWSLKFLPESRGFGVLEAISRDGLPIEQSHRVLLAWVSHSIGTQPESMPPRPKQLQSIGFESGWWTMEPDSVIDGSKAGSRVAVGPVWLERVPARLSLTHSGTQLRVYPLTEQGQRMDALDSEMVRHTGDKFEIELHGHSSGLLTVPMGISPWYELVFN